MDDTQIPELGNGRGAEDGAGDAIDALAAMDPADAPGAAERIAAELAAELEDAGGTATQPVQLRAELGDDTES